MTELVNQKQFAEYCDVTRQAIINAVKNGTVIKDENGLYDLDNENNYKYLREAGEHAKKRERKKRLKEKQLKEDVKNKKVLEELVKREARREEIKEEIGVEVERRLTEQEKIDLETTKTRNAIAAAKARYLYDQLLDK